MKEQIIAILSRYIDLSAYDRGGTSTSIFNSIANEIMQIAEFEELCKPDYAEMHMNDSVMKQNIDAALAEEKSKVAEMPTEEEIDDETIAYAAEYQCGTPFSERWIGFIKGAKWFRNRMISSEKPNNHTGGEK